MILKQRSNIYYPDAFSLLDIDDKIDRFNKFLKKIQKSEELFTIPQQLMQSKNSIKSIGLDFIKEYVVEAIQYALCTLHSEGVMQDDQLRVAERYKDLVVQLLTVCKETTDGQMIHNLIIILFILASYLDDHHSCALASSIFNS
jgi:hypothetical protein